MSTEHSTEQHNYLSYHGVILLFIYTYILIFSIQTLIDYRTTEDDFTNDDSIEKDNFKIMLFLVIFFIISFVLYAVGLFMSYNTVYTLRDTETGSNSRLTLIINIGLPFILGLSLTIFQGINGMFMFKKPTESDSEEEDDNGKKKIWRVAKLIANIFFFLAIILLGKFSLGQKWTRIFIQKTIPY